jgi:hypothetical protein
MCCSDCAIACAAWPFTRVVENGAGLLSRFLSSLPFSPLSLIITTRGPPPSMSRYHARTHRLSLMSVCKRKVMKRRSERRKTQFPSSLFSSLLFYRRFRQRSPCRTTVDSQLKSLRRPTMSRWNKIGKKTGKKGREIHHGRQRVCLSFCSIFSCQIRLRTLCRLSNGRPQPTTLLPAPGITLYDHRRRNSTVFFIPVSLLNALSFSSFGFNGWLLRSMMLEAG